MFSYFRSNGENICENDVVTKRFMAIHLLQVGNKPSAVHETSWNNVGITSIIVK